MFVKGVDGSAKTTYEMDIDIVQDASAAVLEKVAKDTGGDSSNIKALTGVMDFNVTIPDASNHGKIVSLSCFRKYCCPVYYKKIQQLRILTSHSMQKQERCQVGCRFNTLTVYVRDNGKYDADTTLGGPVWFGDSGDSSIPQQQI